MDAARITEIADGITVQARTAAEGDIPAGAWRTIAENGIVNHREELLIESDFACYDFTACKIQRRASSAWADALSLTLDLPSGTSNFRKDRLSVTGSTTNSSVAVVTIEKGDRDLKDALLALQRNSKSRFTLEDGTTRYRAIADEVEFGNRAEMGGFEQEFSGTIVAEREQFEGGEVTPTRGMILTFNGVRFRVTAVKADEISYTIVYASVNR